MICHQITDLKKNRTPLVSAEIARPVPGVKDVLIRVTACGVCHTELDEIEGRTPPPAFPVIPGHQVVGRVVETGCPCGAVSFGGPCRCGLDSLGLRTMPTLPGRGRESVR